MKLTQTYKKLFKEEFSEYDREHLPDIIGKKEGDWFSAHLLRLIAKADLGNRRLLAKGFPEEVRAVNEWQGINEEATVKETTTHKDGKTYADGMIGWALLDCTNGDSVSVIKGLNGQSTEEEAWKRALEILEMDSQEEAMENGIEIRPLFEESKKIKEGKDIKEKVEYFEQDVRSLAKQFLSIYLDENKNELLETMSEYIISKLERSKNPSYSNEDLKKAVGLVEKIYDQITIKI